MGIIRRQAILNTIVNYAGIALGYINIVLIFPQVLSADELGLTRVLFALASIVAQLSSLGTNASMIRFGPFFRTDDKRNHGMLFLAGVVVMIGFLVFSVVYYFSKGLVIAGYQEKSELFIDNYLLVIPFAFLMLISQLFEHFLISEYKTVLPNILRNLLVRLLWLADVALFHFDVIDFNLFILLYVGVYAFTVVVLAIDIWYQKYRSYWPDWKFYRKKTLKLFLGYGGYSVLTGMSGFVVQRIDAIMITMLLGLSNAAIYSVAAYIGTVVSVPFNAINRISFPLLSQAVRSKDYDKVGELYKKSGIVNLVLSGAIFLAIWVNVDMLFVFLPDIYQGGKYVILFIGLAKVFDALMGVNGPIILASKYYRFDTIASFLLAVLTIVTNLIFIPKYQIVGAAMATALSVLVFNVARMIFIWVKMKTQPFTLGSIYALLLLGFSYWIITLIPELDNMWVDFFTRCILVVVLFLVPVYLFRISPDITETIHLFLRKFVIKAKH